MENLILNLKEKLISRRNNEIKKVEVIDKDGNRNQVLISSGKIIELEFVIKAIDELIKDYHKTKS